MKPKEYPKWFDYLVEAFEADSVTDINMKLVKKGVDASDVIAILPGRRIFLPCWTVFYRKAIVRQEIRRVS